MASKSLDAKIVSALSRKRSKLRREGIESIIEFTLDQPVERFIDPDALAGILEEAVSGPNVQRFTERHGWLGFERIKHTLKDNGDTLSDLLPEDVQERIDELLVKSPPPKARWAKDAVDGKLVQKLLAPVFQDTLMNFVNRLPIPGVGSNTSSGSGSSSSRSSSSGGLFGGLRKSVEKRASGVLDAFGGLEDKFKDAAKTFSQSAMTDARNALKARVESDEGKEIIVEIRRQFLETLVETPLDDLGQDLYALPLREFFDLAAPVMEHNRSREPVVAAVRAEIDATLAVEGKRSLREILDEADLLEPVVASATDTVDELAIDYFKSDAFAAWVSELVDL